MPLHRERERETRNKKIEGLYSGEKQSKGFVEKPRIDWFVNFIAFANRNFKGFGKGAKFTPEQKELFEFLDYKVTAEEFRRAEIAALAMGFAVTFFAIIALFIGVGYDYLNPIFLIGALFSFFVPFVAFMLVAYQPQNAAKREQTLALGYMSEVVNYLVTSLRLTPNLERAVEFAAQHGRGKLSNDLKKIVWDVQLGKYLSVEEAIDSLAYKWGKYNDDLKQALMLIRSSSLEGNDAKREMLLEKAAADVLEGSKEKMDGFARAMSQPTVYLYYFGVLLPLMLAIVLPIAGTLSGSGFVFSRPEVLALIYLVALPLGLFLMGSSILGNRPPTYVPPEITENYPNLPARGSMKVAGLTLPILPLALLVFVAALFIGLQLDQTMTVAPLASFERGDVLASKLHIKILDFKPEELFVGLFTILSFIVGIGLAVSIYLYGTFSARKKVQDEIREMEREFKDAIYVLASRLGENRPIEEALKYAVEFLPNSKLAQRVFRKTLDNITTLGMTIDDAIFNDKYGSLKNIPSRTIEGGMRITIDSIGLGVNVAAKSIISLALQLRNAEKIDQLLRNLLSSVTSMLKTMGTFIAPIVLGVVTSLQSVIVSALSSNSGNAVPEASGVEGFGGFSANKLGGLFQAKEGTPSTDPAIFTLIMGIYVIQVVILLTYFNSQVEDSNNKLYTWIEISKALPVATLIFAAVAYLAGSSLGAG